ncbi:hypothetical protein BD779DRAFT_1494772 [Infundibulicybe gibba]|nr:hypothetical protein BD779DRAFT_1494772 [Infundibulicybe gibba]
MRLPSRAAYSRGIHKMSFQKHYISALPLAPASHLLTHNLTPDTQTPSVSDFRNKVLTTGPSVQRRPRLLSPQCHFSYVAPLPIPFPYAIEPPSAEEREKDSTSYIEKWLADREATHERPHSSSDTNPHLRKYYSENREQPRELIGISETGLHDCVPHLDVGDAFALLGTPTLATPFDDEGDPYPSDLASVVNPRNELVDILSGHATLMSPGSEAGIEFAPWSLRYSGHQFGSWAGQLGDGRAISILVTPHPTDPDTTYELQLKGAGRTPFSRSADGLAVLRSSIREYLCSEAMEALSIPTTRSLSLISLPALPVQRERVETACVLTRMAPSFIRIGSFEALNGVANMFFFGGGQQESHWDALRILGEWVSQKVLKLNLEKHQPWGKPLVLEVARRNAKMVAGWQAYGFMHGVINTDNVSILGLTIDYGPYAFMDVFDSFHICNHTDESGRYAYKFQPNMIIYALRALLNALAPLIGAEAKSGAAMTAQWADNASPEQIEGWRSAGMELKDELERTMQETTSIEYGRLMRKRLGLRREISTDESRFFKPLLNIMETHKLDFHLTFRALSTFRPALLDPPLPGKEENGALEQFVSKLLALTPDSDKVDHKTASSEWLEWLGKYAERIEGEKELWGADRDVEREAAAKGANPRFVLRQWVLEEVISKVEKDAQSGKRVLAKVMHMACNPFEPWGAEEDERPEAELDAEEKEERRYCGMGEKKMLGFQCSCSS